MHTIVCDRGKMSHPHGRLPDKFNTPRVMSKDNVFTSPGKSHDICGNPFVIFYINDQ